MTDKQKKVLYRIIATALLYAVLLVMEHIVKPVFMEQWYVTLVLFLIPYFVIGPEGNLFFRNCLQKLCRITQHSKQK